MYIHHYWNYKFFLFKSKLKGEIIRVNMVIIFHSRMGSFENELNTVPTQAIEHLRQDLLNDLLEWK